MSQEPDWERHEELAEALFQAGDDVDSTALSEAYGVHTEVVADVQVALSALAKATALDPPLLEVNARPGEQVGDYELLEQIGRGGFSVVYRARDPVLNVDVALKLLAVPPGVEQQVGDRFTQEARAVARLDHPQIVRVRSAGWDPRGPFLVMDLVPGESLGDRLGRDGPLPVEQALEIAKGLAQALEHAHAEGVLHRDVKPDNVLVTPDGQARLTDFGLARDALAEADSKISRDGLALGTPGFWPPEQANGDVEAIGPASDVYGVGATLYALLTGRPPYAGPHTLAILTAMARGEQIHPASELRTASLGPVPAWLDQVCLRCLARDPEERYPSAAALRAALEGPQPEPSPGPAGRQRRTGQGVALAVGLAAVGGAVTLANLGPTAEPSAPPSASPSTSAAAVLSASPVLVQSPAPAASPAAPAWHERLGEWRLVLSRGYRPVPRLEAALVTAPAAETLYLFGGSLLARQHSRELWSWRDDAWTRLGPAEPGAWPKPRADAAAAWDAGRGRLVLIGGRGPNRGDEWLRDRWEWDGKSWHQLPLPAGLERCAQPSLAYDAGRQRLVLLADRRVYELDPAGRWSEGPRLDRAGRQLVYSAADEQVYLVTPSGWLWPYEQDSFGRSTTKAPDWPSPSAAVAAASAGQEGLLLLACKPAPRPNKPRRLQAWLYRQGQWAVLPETEPVGGFAGLGWDPVAQRAVLVTAPRDRKGERALTLVLEAAE